MAVQNGRLRASISIKPFASGILISLGMGFVGTLCLLTVWHDVRAVAVLGGAAAMFFVLIRVYGSLSRRHDDLRAVYSFTNATSVPGSVRELTAAMLGEVAGLLHAERAAMVMAPGDSETCLVTTVNEDGTVVERLADRDDYEDLAAVAGRPAASRVYGSDSRPSALVDLLDLPALRSGIVSPMPTSAGTLGLLVAEGRIGPVREFGGGDLELLDAFAGHSAVAVERAQMVERLTAEIAANEELIESKDQLIAAVSHELRTPLTGILGYAELLQDDQTGCSDDDHLAYARVIASDALDMSHMVEDLLTAARVPDGHLPIYPREVSLRQLAMQVVEHSGSTAPSPTVTGGPGPAVADEIRVRQVLRNLIANARRYGGDRIDVIVGSDEDTSYVSVRDNGPGIAPEMRERIFAAYESAHDPGTQPGSLGLGLPISRLLARLMGGEVTYEHGDGCSTFRLTLPRSGS